MSITASWIVIAVVAIRFLFKNAPKWLRVVLWGFVGVRLILPFSFESVLSLIPSAETVPPDIVYAQVPKIHSGVSFINSAVNPALSQSLSPNLGGSVNPIQIVLFIAAFVWVLGLALMLVYTAVSYIRIRFRVKEAARLESNIYECDRVDTPFILGVIRPRIYLPSAMSDVDRQYVIAHEKAHIRRFDHVIKPLAFLLLSVYWFNPLLWIAYVLLCRDIELACDERVISDMGADIKKPYSDALINCSLPRRSIAACPLAFGEVGVKERVKSVLNYKKPAFWVIIAAVVVSIVAAVCLLTDPLPDRVFDINSLNINDIDVEYFVDGIRSHSMDSEYIYVNGNNPQITVDRNFNFLRMPRIRYFFFKGKDTYESDIIINSAYKTFTVSEYQKIHDEKTIFLLDHYLMALKYLPQDQILNLAPGDAYEIRLVENGSVLNYSNAITYSKDGVCEIDGWYIHLVVDALYGSDSAGYINGETLHLFFGDKGDGFYNMPENSIDDIQEKYPQYFGLDTSNGLDVIVWQMAENNYNFGLLPHTYEERYWLSDELTELKSVRLDDMRAIIESYGIPQEKIYIVPWQNPLSSYLGEYSIIMDGEDIDQMRQDYISLIEKMLFGYTDTEGGVVKYENDVFYYPIYDTVTFDVDGDGRDEHCTLGYGRTSGIFTFTFTAREVGEQELEYDTTFYSSWYDLSFEKCEDGVIRVKGVDQQHPPKTHLFDISFIDGNVALTENGKHIGEIMMYTEIIK